MYAPVAVVPGIVTAVVALSTIEIVWRVVGATPLTEATPVRAPLVAVTPPTVTPPLVVWGRIVSTLSDVSNSRAAMYAPASL